MGLDKTRRRSPVDDGALKRAPGNNLGRMLSPLLS
jgi:hypothetical protein